MKKIELNESAYLQTSAKYLLNSTRYEVRVPATSFEGTCMQVGIVYCMFKKCTSRLKKGKIK